MKLPFVLARRFVAAETLADTLPKVQELRRDGLFVTLDLLGEHVEDRDTAQAFTDAYVKLIDQMADLDSDLPPNISIKLSMIGQVIDRDFAEANLRRVLETARKHEGFVRLDMEGSDLTQSTLDLFEAVYPDYKENVGIVLQAYLKRTEADVNRMCELGARVRICKGAYGEPPEVAFQDMPTIRDQYKACMRKLLQDGNYPGIATHDDELIAATIAFAREEGISWDRFEFQMLYGLRGQTQREIVSEGYHMRVYVPYGTNWVPYFTRRLRERKENVWFVLRNLFRK
ncbi:proline dehydrogenase family protein [soil metagenome]